ncbi:MAG: hypothetical protein GJ676_09770 [Rhodobacteraceae bacterium]|nr:hypothetical protein [Paracoccaceae bacterium]
MTPFRATFLALLLALPSSVAAGPATDRFAKCLVEKTTRQDRADLIAWMVVGLARHPEVQGLVSQKPNAEQQTAQRMADLFSDLIVKRCPTQAKAAFSEDEDAAFEAAFNVLGEVAAEDMLNDRRVWNSLLMFADLLDEAEIAEALK